MPKIRVEAKDSTQRHLKMVLDGINGKIKVPLSSKSSLGNYGSPQTVIQLQPDRNFFPGAPPVNQDTRFKTKSILLNSNILDRSKYLPSIPIKEIKKQE